MIRLLVYFCSLLTFFMIIFHLLRASKFENIFKKNKAAEIKISYILLSFITSHLLSEIVLRFYDWIEIISKR